MQTSSNDWRLIDSGPCGSAFNMALDEAIAEHVRECKAMPTLRFYEWDRPAVTLGFFQKTQEVDVRFCLEKGIPLVRRLTGGRAVLHGTDLTYSFASRFDTVHFGDTICNNYVRISQTFMEGLQEIGLSVTMRQRKAERRALKNPSCFQSTSFSEITLDEKKLIGSAQKKWTDGFMQQGSIVVDLDDDTMRRIFILKNLEQLNSIARLRVYAPSITQHQIKIALKNAFEKSFGVKFRNETPLLSEYRMAEQLVIERYGLDTWNFSR
jgi:lipoate-protein ligase A